MNTSIDIIIIITFTTPIIIVIITIIIIIIIIIVITIIFIIIIIIILIIIIIIIIIVILVQPGHSRILKENYCCMGENTTHFLSHSTGRLFKYIHRDRTYLEGKSYGRFFLFLFPQLNSFPFNFILIFLTLFLSLL